MSRYLVLIFCAVTLIAGCNRNPDQPMAASPTGPSAAKAAPGSLLGPTSVAPGGISGTFDVAFPPRNDSFDFRNQLETKYQNGLGRSQAPTYVDKEGEVVWTQEYMRYRSNGCDHNSAVQRVMAQIDGQPAGQICAAPPEGLILFPPRTDSFDFRRQLESKYQQFGRGFSSSAVDPEGGVVWTQEYLRYRVNACDHATAVQKVFSQIDGGGVSPTCYVPPCIFNISPATQSVPAAGGTFTAVITRTSGTCTFGSETLAPWVSIVSGGSGAEGSTITYTVAANNSDNRSTAIRVRWPNNSTLLEINQAGAQGFFMTDSSNAPNPVTTCSIKAAGTVCAFTAIAPVTGAATYSWAAAYTTFTHNQVGASPNFQFTQNCGGPGSSAGGTETLLEVTLMVTDANGTVTYRAGIGNQPPLTIKFFTCS